MAKDLKRWAMMNKILIVSLLLIVLFAYSDSENLVGIKQIDSQWQAAGGWSETANVWLIFWETINPAWFNMWIGVLLAIAAIWYLLSKDKSEAVAIFITPAILILTGVQDLIYFVFSPDVMQESMGCWADMVPGVRIVSNLLKETCPSSTAFVLSAIIGVFLAYKAYQYLQKMRRW